ncbi:Crp/Fnr family transcriptional regulator [Pseudomonadota bacterium]
MDVFQEAEQLRKVPMFCKLEPSKLKLLAFTSEAISFSAGEELFHVNDPSDCAYVIMEGEVEILAETDSGEQIVVTTSGANALIGEMAVLSNAPRSATLRAKGQVNVLRISNESFLRLLSENAEIALDVMRQLSEKLARSHEQVVELLNQS